MEMVCSWEGGSSIFSLTGFSFHQHLRAGFMWKREKTNENKEKTQQSGGTRSDEGKGRKQGDRRHCPAFWRRPCGQYDLELKPELSRDRLPRFLSLSTGRQTSAVAAQKGVCHLTVHAGPQVCWGLSTLSSVGGWWLGGLGDPGGCHYPPLIQPPIGSAQLFLLGTTLRKGIAHGQLGPTKRWQADSVAGFPTFPVLCKLTS